MLFVPKQKVPSEWVVNFMRRVAHAVDAHSTPDLARSLGLIVPTDIRNLQNWVTGTSAPDFENVLFMLREAEMLKDPSLAADIPTPEDRVQTYFGKKSVR